MSGEHVDGSWTVGSASVDSLDEYKQSRMYLALNLGPHRVLNTVNVPEYEWVGTSPARNHLFSTSAHEQCKGGSVPIGKLRGRDWRHVILAC